jgi:hypothetical protein
MSKINPDDGMDVGTVVIVVDARGYPSYVNGDYGTIIEDDGDDIPRVRLSSGEKYWMYLHEIRPKTLNDATPAEWDKVSKYAYAGDTTAMLGAARVHDQSYVGNASYASFKKARDEYYGVEDVIDSPAHYNNGGIECIDYIRQQLGEEGYIAYCEGNMIKYQHRYKYKGGVEDLEKSCKYQEWLIEALKKKEEIAMAEMTQRNL